MSSSWGWSCSELGRLIGVVTSGARSSYVPIRVVRDAIPEVRDEMLVLIDDIVEDRRFLGAIKSATKLDIAIDSSSLPTTFSPETTLKCSAPFMRTYVEIFGEISRSGRLELSMAIPRPGSHVYLVEDGARLSKVLNLPRGLYVGNHKFSNLELHLDPRAIDYHMAIVGATGTGKSRLVKALIEEILANTDYGVIVFDHTGVDYADRSRWKRVKDELGIEPRVLDGSQIVLDPLTVAEIIVERTGVSSYLEDHVYYCVARYVQDQVAKAIEGKAGIEFNAKELDNYLSKYFELVERQKGFWKYDEFLSRMIKYLKELNAKDSTVVKLSMLIALNLGRSFFDSYLSSRSIDIRKVVDDVIEKRDRLVIVDLSTEIEQAAKRFVVAQTLRYLWSRVLETRRRAEVAVVIDEAHNYACQRCEPSASEIERTCREGRKWGIGIILASQRIRDLSTDVRGNVNTVMFSRLQTSSDYQELRGWVEGVQYVEHTLPLLAPREFFVVGLANPLRKPLLVRVRDVE